MPNPPTITTDDKKQNIPRIGNNKIIKPQRLTPNYIQDLILLGKLDSSIQDCVLSLNKDPLSRKQTDIERIKSFLETTEFATKFRSDNFSAESLDKILIMCAGEMKHTFLERGKILFHIGDIGDSFYIILQGKIAVLQPKQITEQMTGFEFYRHILQLRKNNEMYMLTLTIEANREIVEIDKKDIPVLNLILLVMCIQDYFAHVNFIGRTLIEILTLCGVEPHFFDGIIDETNNTVRDPHLLENIEKKIFDRLPKFDQSLIQRYHILSDNSVRFKVNVFKYKNIIELGKGSFFGDTALDKLTTRNATIKTIEDTHFCCLGNHHYNSYIRIEKQRLTNKEISFLVDNFFFKNIPYKLFEHKTFAYFYYGERTKGEIICKENHPLEYLYFIKEGKVELTIKKTIPELYDTAIQLSKLKYNFPITNTNPNLNTNINTIPVIEQYPKDQIAKDNFLDLVIKSKIYNYSHKEVIGFESLCFGLNYLYTAEVISEKVKLYKVHKTHVMKMLHEDSSYYERYEHDGSKKMLVFLKRLVEIYQTKLEMYEKTTKKQIYANAFDEHNIDRTGFGSYTNEHFEYCPTLKVFKKKNVKQDMNDLVLPKTIRGSTSKMNIPNALHEKQQSAFFTSVPLSKHKQRSIHYNHRRNISTNDEYMKTLSYPTIQSNNSHVNFMHTTDEGVFSVKNEERLLRKIQKDINKDKLIFSTILANKKISKDGVDLNDIRDRHLYHSPELKRKFNLVTKYKVANQNQCNKKPFVSNVTLEKIQKYKLFDSPSQLGSFRCKDKGSYTLRDVRNGDDEFMNSKLIIETYNDTCSTERITVKTKPIIKYRFKPRKRLKVINKTDVSFEVNTRKQSD